MKALEILKKLNKAGFYEEYYPSKNTCNEAIKEIEELNNRSCENCKKQDTFMCPVTSFDKNMEDFSCNRYEAKGE